MTERASDLWKKLKPYAVRDLSAGLTGQAASGGGGGGGGMSAHAIDGVYHTVSGSQYQIVGLTGTNTIGLLTPASDGSAGNTILLTDGSGNITVTNATATKVLTDEIETSTLLLDTSVKTEWTNLFNSSNYNGASNTGISMVEDTGSIFAQNIQSTSMTVETFTAAVKRALAGELIISVSESLTSRQQTLPSDYVSSMNLYVWDIPGHKGMDVFKRNSWVKIPFSQVLTTGDGEGAIGSSVAYAEGTRDGTGTTTYIDDDFDGWKSGSDSWTTVDPTVESGGVWRATGNGNSMVPETGKWLFEDLGSGDVALKALSSTFNSHCHYNSINAADVKITGKVRLGDTAEGWGVTAYSQYINNEDAYVRVRYRNGNMEVYPHGYSFPTSGTDDFSYTFTADTWYQFRMEVETSGDEVDCRFRLWADGDSEPGTWQINCTFTGANRPQPGTVGFWAGNIDEEVYYDDILVTSIGTAAVAASATVTLDIDPDVDTHAIFAASVTNTSATPGFDSVPAGLTQVSNYTSFDGIIRVYYLPITTEDGETSYTFTGDSNASDIFVSAFTLRGLDSYITTTFDSTSTADQSIAGGSDTGSPPTFRVNVTAKHTTQAGEYKKTPTSSTIAAYKTSRSGNVTHLATVQKTRNDVYEPVEIVDFTDTWSVSITLTFSENVVASGETGLRIGSAYGKVTSRTTPGDLEDGEQCWLMQLLDETDVLVNNNILDQYTIPGSDGLGVTIPADTPVINLGWPWDGVVDITTLDQKGAPYMQFGLVDQHPSLRIPKVRIGQLKGFTGYDSFGLVAEHAGAKLEVSSRIAEMVNVPLYLRDGRTVDLIADPVSGLRLRTSSSLTGAEVSRTIDWAGGDDLESVYSKIWGYDSGTTIAMFSRAYNSSRAAAYNFLQAIDGTGANIAEFELFSDASGSSAVATVDDFQVDGDFNTTGFVAVGNTSNESAALYIDNGAVGASFPIRIACDSSFTSAALVVNATDNGSGDGPYFKIQHNNNGTTPAPGSFVLRASTGTSYTIWPDDSGNLRVNTMGGEGVNSTEKSGGTVIGTQTSSEKYKLLQRHVGADKWSDALKRVQVAAEQSVYEFTYKKDQWRPDPEVFQGVVLERGAAHYGMDRDAEKFPVGRSLNVVNAIGDLMQAVAEINRKLEAM